MPLRRVTSPAGANGQDVPRDAEASKLLGKRRDDKHVPRAESSEEVRPHTDESEQERLEDQPKDTVGSELHLIIPLSCETSTTAPPTMATLPTVSSD